jgi:hypothetical protein
LVARGLETEWESRLRDLATAENELRQREQHQARNLTPEQMQHLRALGADLRQVWTAPTTTDRDRKELLRSLLEEVIISIERTPPQTQIRLRWKGGAITPLEVPIPRRVYSGIRTGEDTIELLTRLASLYPDDVIAGILNRQGRKTATGERFKAICAVIARSLAFSHRSILLKLSRSRSRKLLRFWASRHRRFIVG